MEQLRKSIEGWAEEARQQVRQAESYNSLSNDILRTGLYGVICAYNKVLYEISRIEALETEKAGNTTPEPLNARNGAKKEEKP